MNRRKAKRQGKKSERGGKISEGKIVSSKFKGYKEIARRARIGRREIDSLLQRGNKIVHLETTKTCITKPRLEKLFDKYKQTRIATGANQFAIQSPCVRGPAQEFAKDKKIKIV